MKPACIVGRQLLKSNENAVHQPSLIAKSRSRRWLQQLSKGLGAAFHLLAVGLVAVSLWAAGANIVMFGWRSDAAAWVQAAGSIAAIVSAISLVGSEARRARKARREQREEAAWYVRFAVVQAQFESQIIAAELVNRTAPINQDDVRKWRQQAFTTAVSLNALTNHTDHVHPAVTQILSNAKVLIDYLIADLDGISRILENGETPKDAIIVQIVSAHRALFELVELYDARIRGVRAALDESDDALPIHSWAAWGHKDHKR